MTRSCLAALGLVAMLLALAPSPAHAQSNISLVINVHTASAIGCGDPAPLYSYRVFVDGAQVAASGAYEPTNGAVEYYDLQNVGIGSNPTVTVGFEVLQHTNGFFSSTATPCNLTSTDATRYSIAYTVGAPQVVRSAGAHGAAGIDAFVSDSTQDAPEQPHATIAGAPTASTVNVTYGTLHVPGFQRAELRNAHDARAVLDSATTSSGATLVWSGLDEDRSYGALVRAIGGSWAVNSNEVDFKTANIAPPAPEIRVWYANDTHASGQYSNAPRDLARLDVYLSTDPAFAPSDATLVKTLQKPFFTFIDFDGLRASTTYYVQARATDDGGLSTWTTTPVVFATSATSQGSAAAPPPSQPTARPPPPSPTPTPSTAPTPQSTPTPTQPRATPPVVSSSVDANLTGDGLHYRTYDSLKAAFELRVDGGRNFSAEPLELSPGESATLDLLFINHGVLPLTVDASTTLAAHNDSDIGGMAAAFGFDIVNATPHHIDLSAKSKVAGVATVVVPRNATLGDTVGVVQWYNVTDGATYIPFAGYDVLVRVVAPKPVVAVTTSTAGGAGPFRASVLVAAGLGGAGVLAVSAAVLLRRDNARYLVAAALYTRLSRQQVLDHPMRDALRGRIEAAPGITYSDLQRASGLNAGALVHHLRALERAGAIASRKDGQYRRFYVVGAAPAQATFTVSPLTPQQTLVLDALRERALTQGELALKLGLSQQGTSHHVKTLERLGHIQADYDGRVWRYSRVQDTTLVRP